MNIFKRDCEIRGDKAKNPLVQRNSNLQRFQVDS